MHVLLMHHSTSPSEYLTGTFGPHDYSPAHTVPYNGDRDNANSTKKIFAQGTRNIIYR